MGRGSSSIGDFPVAPRRARTASPEQPVEQMAAKLTQQMGDDEDSTAAAPATGKPSHEIQPPQEVSPSSVILPTPEARKERAAARSLEQEASRLRLHDLKQKKARESKHFVNCPLDYETKKRLERAASENDVKMTVIVKAAIDQFLRDNGY